MNIVEAFQRFADPFIPSKDWGYTAKTRYSMVREISNGVRIHMWPAMMTAACWMTGDLDRAGTDEQLKALLEHYYLHLASHVYSTADQIAEAYRVVCEVMMAGVSMQPLIVAHDYTPPPAEELDTEMEREIRDAEQDGQREQEE